MQPQQNSAGHRGDGTGADDAPACEEEGYDDPLADGYNDPDGDETGDAEEMQQARQMGFNL